MSSKKFLLHNNNVDYWVVLLHQNTSLQVMLVLPSSGQSYRGTSNQCEYSVFLSMSEQNSSVTGALQGTSLVFHGATLPNTECTLELNCNTTNNRFEFLLWFSAEQANQSKSISVNSFSRIGSNSILFKSERSRIESKT